MVCGSGKEVAKTIEISPNAYVPDATNRKAERIKSLRTKLLVPNRIRWNTFHAVAHLVTEPVISNVYFMVKTNLNDERLKALVLWLNSFGDYYQFKECTRLELDPRHNEISKHSNGQR
ncbi:MAG: hypothetical protein ABIM42_05890 [candidate division WOR-3 bacterium]